MICNMTDTIKELRIALVESGGRAVTLLSEAGARYSFQPDYFDCLVTLAADQDDGVSDGATWLIKSHLDGGGALSGIQISRVLSRIDQVQSWAAQLHICQITQYLIISIEDAGHLVNWLQPLLTHSRPFLRAWSLDAFFRISIQHPEFTQRVQECLCTATSDPAASVRARVRNLTD